MFSHLASNKKNVITDILRALKTGGYFSISDIVLIGELPVELQHDSEIYAGCVARSIQKDTYIGSFKETVFVNVTVQKKSLSGYRMTS